LTNASVDRAVDAFYATRGGAPLWLRDGANTAAAREVIAVLERAALDGMNSGPLFANEARALLARATAGDPEALARADRLLSIAWVRYVGALQTPPPGMVYGDAWVAPRQQTAQQILMLAAAAPSLTSHVRQVSAVNPIYARLRDAAWATMQANGGSLDPRALVNLERAREMPVQKRYIMVDTAGARLYMIEDGRIVDSMRVIVGKPDPSKQTPMLASTIYYTTLNPYWHVPGDLIRTLIAPNVLEKGVSYLTERGYQVMEPGSNDLLNPAKVDWRAVAAGREQVRVRQLPGPGNSMGRMKIGFPNDQDIFLHDTPVKELFAQSDRMLSNGCVRLQDAQRLGRWLLGRDPVAPSSAPEQNVALPTPVPIYLTYLTAQPDGSRLTFLDDVYGRDAQRLAQTAALR